MVQRSEGTRASCPAAEVTSGPSSVQHIMRWLSHSHSACAKAVTPHAPHEAMPLPFLQTARLHAWTAQWHSIGALMWLGGRGAPLQCRLLAHHDVALTLHRQLGLPMAECRCICFKRRLHRLSRGAGKQLACCCCDGCSGCDRSHVGAHAVRQAVTLVQGQQCAVHGDLQREPPCRNEYFERSLEAWLVE